MEQELVTLTQPTADDIPLLAGGHLRIAHTTNTAHDIHYSVRTIRNSNDDLQGITPNILLRPLTPAHSTLPQPFIAAKSRYRDTPRHSWQAIRLFATEYSDAQLPEPDNRFPAEENAADIIAALRRTQNITRATVAIDAPYCANSPGLLQRLAVGGMGIVILPPPMPPTACIASCLAGRRTGTAHDDRPAAYSRFN